MSATKVLSTEEVDALLNMTQNDKIDFSNVSGGLNELGGESTTGLNQKAIDNIVELTAAECQKIVSSFLRKKIAVISKLRRSITLHDCLGDKVEQNVYSVLHLNSHDCYGMVAVDLVLLDQVINFLYGGDINNSSSTITSIGKVGIIIAEKISQLFVDGFVQATKDYGKVSCEIMKTIPTPNLTSKMSMDDVVNAIDLTLALGGLESTLTIMVSESFFQKFYPKNETIVKQPVENNFWRTSIQTQVVDSYVPINVTLTDTKVPLSELMKLKVGDLIPIGDPTLAYVCLNSLKLFKAIAGQVNSKRVIKIQSEI